MAKRARKSQKSETKLQEFVVVTFTNNLEQAQEYEALLKTDNIPVTIKEQNSMSSNESKDFAVMVPEEFLDEAYVIIESQDAYDDFYDFALENERDNDDFDDLLEEEFE
jgi:hypothetical protein